MTRLPTDNFAVGKGIPTRATYMVGFPRTSACPAPIPPYQLFIASDIRVVMSSSSAFTFGWTGRDKTPCPSPRLSNHIFWKCHITPPCYSRDNDYSTISANVKPLSNRRWWGRIELWIATLFIYRLVLRWALYQLPYLLYLTSRNYCTYYQSSQSGFGGVY